MPKKKTTSMSFPSVCRKKAGGEPTINLCKYRQRLQAKLDEYLALMKEHWGFRPDIRVHLTNDVVARADFNLKGFAHQGRRIQIKAEHAEGRHNPEKTARQIAQELVLHRNTCDRCGENIPPLWQRASSGDPAYGRNLWIWFTDADGQMRSRPARPEELALFDLPPDPVERALMPGLARRLERRLKEKAEAALKQQEARAREQEYENVSTSQTFQSEAIIALRRKSDGQQLHGVIKGLRVEEGRFIVEVELVEDDCAIRRKIFLGRLAVYDANEGGETE